MASFWDMLTGNAAADAANAAAQDTWTKQQAAIQGLNTYGATLPGIYEQLYAPYAAAGAPAVKQLMGGLGLGGAGGASDFTQAYQALPGYKSGLATGQQAAERAINAGGGLNSGAALKQLYRYGSDYENQRAGDYISRLGNLAGIGFQGTQGQGQGIGAQTGLQSQAAGMNFSAAPTIGQGQVAGAQAQQQGIGNLLNTAAYLGGAFLGGPKKLPTWG